MLRDRVVEYRVLNPIKVKISLLLWQLCYMRNANTFTVMAKRSVEAELVVHNRRANKFNRALNKSPD